MTSLHYIILSPCFQWCYIITKCIFYEYKDYTKNWIESTKHVSLDFISSKCIESQSEVTQSCATLCNPIVCSLPGSSVHGIFQARILEWVAISFSRRSSQLRDWTQVSRIAGRCFTLWATREAHIQLHMLCLLFLHTHLNTLFYSLIPTHIKQHVSLLQRITDTH